MILLEGIAMRALSPRSLNDGSQPTESCKICSKNVSSRLVTGVMLSRETRKRTSQSLEHCRTGGSGKAPSRTSKMYATASREDDDGY